MNNFIKDLDAFSQKTCHSLFPSIDGFNILEIKIEVRVDDDFINKYELNKDVRFVLTIKNIDEGVMSYYYKKIKIDPECYFIRPKNYQQVSTEVILKECIKQDTHKPNIKKLEIMHP